MQTLLDLQEQIAAAESRQRAALETANERAKIEAVARAQAVENLNGRR